MTNTELHTDLRTAVRELCSRFPDTYWRELDAKEAYPEEFVKTLTEAGFLAALIPSINALVPGFVTKFGTSSRNPGVIFWE